MEDEEQAEFTARRVSVLMPSDVSSRLGFFDRMAGHAADIVSRAPFFAFCVALVGVWLIQGVIAIS
jgi:hypothetical protein